MWNRVRSFSRKAKIKVLRIPDVYPGSEFFHPGSRIRIKEFKYFFTPKNWFPSLRNFDPGEHPGSGSRIRILIFINPGSRIQGSKRHRIPDPEPKIVICFRTFTYCHRRVKRVIINRSNAINLTKTERINTELNETIWKIYLLPSPRIRRLPQWTQQCRV